MTSSIQHLVDAVALGSLYALFALSIAVIFGVARIINFANGELIAFGSYGVLWAGGVPWPIAVAVSLTVVIAAAFVMERAVFRQARSAAPSTLLVVSLALSLLIQNLLLLTEGARPQAVDFGGGLVEATSIAGIRVAKIDLVTIALTAALLVGLVALLKRTTLGLQLRGAAEDFEMTRRLGVAADRVIVLAFVLSGFLAACAGLLLVAQTATLTPTLGVQPVLVGFIATVIGGLGSLGGAVAGGFFLGALTVLLQIFLPEAVVGYRDVFVFGAVILVLLWRPRGLASSSALVERV